MIWIARNRGSVMIDTGLGISNIYEEVLHTPGHSPGHHSLDIELEILIRMREVYRNFKADGKLHHGSRTFDYGDWGVWL